MSQNKNNKNYAGYKIIYKKPQEQISNELEGDQTSESEDYMPENDDNSDKGKKLGQNNKRKKKSSVRGDKSDAVDKKKTRKGRPAGSKNKQKMSEYESKQQENSIEGQRSSKRIKFNTREGFRRDLQKENWPGNEQITQAIQPFLDQVKEIPALSIEELKMLYSCLDLTSLNSTDSDDSLRDWIQKSLVDVHTETELKPAAICVYSNFSALTKHTLFYNQIQGVNTAVVSTNFPTGQTFLEVKNLETKTAVKYGADEIDMVVSRGLWNEGKEEDALEEIYQVKKSCGQAHLKVILENCELKDYAAIYKLSFLSLCAGGDFIKTSTGKGKHGALLNEFACMLLALRDFIKEKGVKGRGIKAAGGVQDTITAMKFYKLTQIMLEIEINPSNFRIGTSSLAPKIVQQIKELKN